MRERRLTEEALTDLDEISAYIHRDDPATAKVVIKRIEENIETVLTFPGLGKPTSKSGVFVHGGTRNQPFRFTYRYSDDHLEVLRVFRASRERIQF